MFMSFTIIGTELWTVFFQEKSENEIKLLSLQLVSVTNQTYSILSEKLTFLTP